MKKRFTHSLVIFCALFLLILPFSVSAAEKSPEKTEQKTKSPVEDILSKIEAKYNSPGFSATFTQKSYLAAMQMTEEASGSAVFKKPGKMKWTYDTPEKQLIITDGTTLWIYRPEDSQVMTGKPDSYLADGKGGSLLSDIKMIRKKFDVSYSGKNANGDHELKLVPKELTGTLTKAGLVVSASSYEIMKIIYENENDDRTELNFRDIKFGLNPPDADFVFKIPEGVHKLKLGAQEKE
jgi:outer membrane lipoprotein carrier protein